MIHDATIIIHKQTILSFFDNAAFVLISCYKSDRHMLAVICKAWNKEGKLN